jgi:general secretion pathway protein A
LHVSPKIENFCWRIEQAHLREGGFALVHGDPGSGKSVVMPLILNELRLLSSACFDSQSLLCVVLSGDARLLDKLRREELIPLGSRIRTRLATELASREELLACLDHLLKSAGNATLMTKELRHTLVDHAAGNYRIFVSMAGELLMSAAQREITTLDEKLYLQVFARPETTTSRRVAARN